MRKTIVLISAAVVLTLAIAPPSQAVVIDFNLHPPDFQTPTTEGDFTFAFDAAGRGIFGPGGPGSVGANYNGTTALYAAGDPAEGRRASVLMYRTDGDSFEVSSFLAATFFMEWTEGTLDVIGTINGGGTVSTSFQLTSDFTTFLLPDTFTNLDSLMFRDSASGAFLGSPGFSIDDIDLSRATAVPEPGSLSFLGLGLTALILAHRRRQG